MFGSSVFGVSSEMGTEGPSGSKRTAFAAFVNG